MAMVGPDSLIGEIEVKLTEVVFQRIFCPEVATANWRPQNLTCSGLEWRSHRSRPLQQARRGFGIHFDNIIYRRL